jgi:hypothetical protein
LNGFTFGALTFVIVVGIWEANPDTLRDQPFLLDGSKGVSFVEKTTINFHKLHIFT